MTLSMTVRQRSREESWKTKPLSGPGLMTALAVEQDFPVIAGNQPIENP